MSPGNTLSHGCWLASLLALLLVAPPTRAQEPPRKPNVLFIVCDDLNNNLGCYQHPAVKSPHIDRLAERGVRFDRAYCQYPICNPSRTSFLSGLRPGAGMKALDQAVWLPKHFQNNGYFVTCVRKVAHTPAMAERCGFPTNERSVGEPAQRAVELLEQNKDKQFFIAVGLSHTHPGYQHKPEFLKLYPADKIVWPKEPDDVRANVPPVAFTGYASDGKLTDDERRKHMASYYAAISTLDAQVGIMLDALERLKLTENTIVVFTSDHGRHLGEHGGIYDKRSLFEESVRVPLIVAAPSKKAKAASGRPVELIDLYPTLAQLAGLPEPKGVEGTSFVPLLEDPSRPWKKAAFSVSGVSGTMGRSLRTERYRYTQWDEQNAQLYDHENDPRELVNLVSDPLYKDILAEMRQLLSVGWRGALPVESKEAQR